MLQTMLHAIGAFLGSSPLHQFMIDVGPAFPAAEALHFIGLSLLFGSLLLIDLRGLGMFRAIPLVAVHRLVPIAILGFAINLATGVLFIAFDPASYIENTAFQWKLALIAAAGINALAFELLVFRRIKAGDAAAENGLAIKLTSGLSLLLWTGVLVAGRLIPFI